MRTSARLRRTTDIERVRRDGARRADRYFVVAALPNEAGGTRLAIGLPARLGTAVRRNRARRRARAAFQPYLARLRPADLLVTAREAVLDAPFADLQRAAERLLADHGLLARPDPAPTRPPSGRGRRTRSIGTGRTRGSPGAAS